jgi:hypothetical protein
MMVTKMQKQETREQLEKEFVEIFRHNWASDGGSVRPVGLRKMTKRELKHCIDTETKPLMEVS